MNCCRVRIGSQSHFIGLLRLIFDEVCFWRRSGPCFGRVMPKSLISPQWLPQRFAFTSAISFASWDSRTDHFNENDPVVRDRRPFGTMSVRLGAMLQAIHALAALRLRGSLNVEHAVQHHRVIDHAHERANQCAMANVKAEGCGGGVFRMTIGCSAATAAAKVASRRYCGGRQQPLQWRALGRE
jgi:hypothetical protein